MAQDGMRIGMLGIHYPPPQPLSGVAEAEWEIEQASALGLRALHHYRAPVDAPPEELDRLGQMAQDAGIELECELPWDAFTLDPSLAAATRGETARGIAAAERLGADIVRGGYGCITLDTTRYARHRPINRHLADIAKTVRETARLAADHGLLLAVENHCDFSGAEIVRILETVDLPNVGAAVDTGNSFPVFCDWRADAEAMAPWAIATHFKDMRVAPNPHAGVPFTVEGCILGEGDIDVPWIIEQLRAHSPRGDALRLIVEIGWPPDDPVRDAGEQMRDMMRASLDYLHAAVS